MGMATSSRRPVRGFSLVEMLAVMGILGILMGLLLPAIQAVRESARQTSCANNLKQIGVALAGHESATGAFPAGILSSAWRSGATDQAATLLTGPVGKFGFYEWSYFLHELLPRLEQQAYYDGLRGPLFRVRRIPADTTTLASQNRTSTDVIADYSTVNGVSIQTLLCPSDAQASGLWTTPTSWVTSGSIRLAKSNYLGLFSGTNVQESVSRILVNGTVPGTWSEQVVQPLPLKSATFDRRAVFGFAQGTPSQAIKDGLANTLAVAEHLRGTSDLDGRGAFWLNDAGMQMLHARTKPNDAVPDILPGDRASADSDPQDWGCFTRKITTTVTSGTRKGSTTTTTTTTWSVRSVNNQPAQNLPCTGGTVEGEGVGIDGSATSRSRHPGGVNVLFCDGHVQLVGDSIESNTVRPYGTWQRLAWIDDDQPVTPP